MTLSVKKYVIEVKRGIVTYVIIVKYIVLEEVHSTLVQRVRGRFGYQMKQQYSHKDKRNKQNLRQDIHPHKLGVSSCAPEVYI